MTAWIATLADGREVQVTTERTDRGWGCKGSFTVQGWASEQCALANWGAIAPDLVTELRPAGTKSRAELELINTDYLRTIVERDDARAECERLRARVAELEPYERKAKEQQSQYDEIVRICGLDEP